MSQSHPSRFPLSLLILCLLGLSLAMPAPAALPPEVAAALAQDDCEKLQRLNRRYWRATTEPEAAPELGRIARLLEERILSLPLCGQVAFELLRVQPASGLNFFDPRTLWDLEPTQGPR